MATGKKYYWLKLDKDFFKRHDIRIVEAMDNGKDYILFYLKLLCESTSHNGNLRFSETIPYDVKMLSVVTNTNIDIAEKSIRIFTELGMMETLDDGTIYMNEINKMLGYETDYAKKMREYRGKQDLIESGYNVANVYPSCNLNVRQEKEIEIDIEKERKIYKKKESFKKPTIEEIKAYCGERKNNIDPTNFYDFYESKGWMVGKNKMKDWKACVRTWEKSRKTNTKNETDTPNWYINYEEKWKKTEDTKEEEELTDAARQLFSSNK